MSAQPPISCSIVLVLNNALMEHSLMQMPRHAQVAIQPARHALIKLLTTALFALINSSFLAKAAWLNAKLMNSSWIRLALPAIRHAPHAQMELAV